MNSLLAEKLETVIEILRSIQQELNLPTSGEPIFPEHRKVLIEKGICLSCGEPILEGEKEVRKVHRRCRTEQTRSGKSDFELVSLGLLAPEEPSGRKPQNRLEKAIAQQLGAVAEGLPIYDISAGNPTPKQAEKIIKEHGKALKAKKGKDKP